jgi:hypothetical protein
LWGLHTTYPCLYVPADLRSDILFTSGLDIQKYTAPTVAFPGLIGLMNVK